MEKITIRFPGEGSDGVPEIIKEETKPSAKDSSKKAVYNQGTVSAGIFEEVKDKKPKAEAKEQDKKEADDLDEKPVFIEESERFKRVKTLAGIATVVVAIIAGFFMVIIMKKYSGYEVTDSWKIKNASASKYAIFKGFLLKYGSDGAILNDEKGGIIWNEGFEMNSPRIDINGEYLILYDKGGSDIYVMTNAGEKAVISTHEPVNVAEVSNQGTVATVSISNDKTKALVEMYGLKGELIASGEIHLENGGFPTDIALSPDGRILMVSTVSFASRTVTSGVYFYNFGKAGKDEIDNIVSSYKYENMLIPEVDITSKGDMIAIGSNKIVVYSGTNVPKERKIIEPESEMKSVVHNDRYIGYVVAKADDNGKVSDVIELYTLHGFRRYARKVDFEYKSIKLLGDNELLLSDGSRIRMINIFGIEKLDIEEEDDIHAILNKKAGREYYFVRSDKIDQVKLQ